MKQAARIAIPTFDSAENYLNALTRLGAEPVTVCTPCDPAAFDALLLPGGGDVAPERYGQKPFGSNPPDAALDELQFAVLKSFVAAEKPVFGICRGLQVINVCFGGTLEQDISQAIRHRRIENDQVHDTIAAADSFLATLYGERFAVNSAHHQAVALSGKGLRIVQRSDDGVAEAICHDALPVWAVQWHPERMCFERFRTDCVDGSKVLRWFLTQCE